jgi:hypothetical protein
VRAIYIRDVTRMQIRTEPQCSLFAEGATRASHTSGAFEGHGWRGDARRGACDFAKGRCAACLPRYEKRSDERPPGVVAAADRSMRRELAGPEPTGLQLQLEASKAQTLPAHCWRLRSHCYVQSSHRFRDAS